ncbi:CPBP family intramembrane glutamic endopeptidase [Pseudochelatococcus sp. B33]
MSRWLSVGLLAVGYGAAAVNGQLGSAAAVPLLLLLAAAWAVGQDRSARLRHAGHALFVALAVLLSLHWLPGFHNPRVIGPERFTPDAVPFTMYLNLDKPLVGFWLLLVLPWIRPRHTPRASLATGLGGMLIAVAACLAAAVLLGIVAWAPKWPSAAWLWLLNNLLLVTVTEEAFMRGYLQGGLSRALRQRPHGDTVALLVAAAAFGLMHAAGGWPWIVLGSLAGLGYGVAYRYGGLQASVLAHFGLNAAHFCLFTYPMLQPAAP